MTSSALKVTEINHVALFVTDVNRSRGFYMEILGFEDIQSTGRGQPRSRPRYVPATRVLACDDGRRGGSRGRRRP